MGYLIQLGTYAPLLDTFTAVLDCNDGQNLEVAELDGLALPSPVLDVYTAANPRLHGERVTQSTYGSRHITLTVTAGPAASYAGLQTILQMLLRLQETVRVARMATLNGQTSATRIALLLQPPGSTTPVYADVLALSHDLPAMGDAQSWVRAVQRDIGIDLFCAPFLRGNRVTLQNLVNNAGFEVPAQTGTLAFADTFANANAYTENYQQQIINDGAQLFWRLGEASGTTANTLVGVGAGTITAAGVTIGVAGALVRDVNKAMTFTAASAGRIVASPTSPASINSAWSVELWVSNGTTGKIFGTRGPSDGGMDIQITSTTCNIALGNGTSFQTSYVQTVTWPGAAWWHIVITATPTLVKLYVNGALQGTGGVIAFTPLLYTTGHNVYIGHNGQGTDPYGNGSLDEVALYATILSAATILTHYQVGQQTLTLAQDTFRYSDVVLVDNPLRYYRLDEASGATAYNATGGNNGTYSNIGGITYGVTGALTGDSDVAVTLAHASNSAVALPLTGLAIGNSPWSLECWIKFASNPSGGQVLMSWGAPSIKQAVEFVINTSAQVTLSTISNDTATSSALSTNTWHHVVGTWDQSTLRLYIDGAAGPTLVSGALNFGATYAWIGSDVTSTPSSTFNGSIDECAIYSTALSASRILSHYIAGTTTPVTVANTLVVPASTSIAFGSPSWQTINQWQTRLRWVTGLTATFFLHYTDAADYLAASVSGTQLTLVQVVAGTTYTLGTTSLSLVNGMQYWLQAALFPGFGQPPLTQALLQVDAGGTPGALLAATGPVPLHDAVTALIGQPLISSVGAALGLSTNIVKLFGPGGWYLQTSGTGVASAAWEQRLANTFGGGPAQSFAAGRCDAPPAGTFNANWISGDTASATRVVQTAIPVAAPGNVLGVAVQVRSSGVASTCTQRIFFSEYDANGSGLRTGAVIASVSGAQSAYVTLAGSYTTGANCAYVLLNLNALDATTASAGGSVWFDNAQVWDQTTTGMTVMPYCELAVGNAPAQLLVSGLQGDVPAPCQMAFGVQPAGAGLAASGSLTLYAGRRALAGFGAQLVGAALQGQQDGVNQKMVVDATSWSGVRDEFHNGAANYQPLFMSGLIRDYVGVYHLIMRLRMVDTPATSQNLIAQAYLLQHPWLGNTNKLDRLSIFSGTPIFPFTGASWQLADAGQLVLPPFPLATQGDGAQVYTTIAAQSTTAAIEMDADWGALMPVDGELLAATFQNNSIGPTLSGWIWLYFDGLSLHNAAQATASWSFEATRLPNPAHAGGGAGVVAQATPSIISVGDTLPRVDPTITTTNGTQTNSGVNQWVVVATDNAATVLSMTCQITYAPLYLEPR